MVLEWILGQRTLPTIITTLMNFCCFSQIHQTIDPINFYSTHLKVWLINCFQYLLPSKCCPGLESIAKHFPQSHSKGPHVRGRGEAQVVDALRGTPVGEMWVQCHSEQKRDISWGEGQLWFLRLGAHTHMHAQECTHRYTCTNSKEKDNSFMTFSLLN